MEIIIKINIDDSKNVTVNTETHETVKDISVNASNYARIFDDGCVGWCKDPEYSLMFLKMQEQYANDILRAKGHIFLNDVYDLLGIPHSKAGQIVGWVYNEENPLGDNYVDFGINQNEDFVNGLSNVAMLDFNVDGNILDRI
ncbi:MAG: hypothetical protein J6B01_04425 [Ruminococcus sp.]|nr:hypothetical protein [Ruminococcus sp.]